MGSKLKFSRSLEFISAFFKEQQVINIGSDRVKKLSQILGKHVHSQRFYVIRNFWNAPTVSGKYLNTASRRG